MNSKLNVASIIASRDLCISCGACEVVCPSACISLAFKDGQFVPSVNEEKCTNCQLCLKTCPSFRVDLKNKSRKGLFEGKEIASYTAFSKDPIIRRKGTSGGVVTQLIVSLLKNGVYDKATYLHYPLLDMNRRAEIQVSDNQEVLRNAAKSKYLPASIDELLRYMQSHPMEKFIVTSTPCQLTAIRRFIQLNHLNPDNYLFIGLFCDMTMNYNFMEFISWKYGKYDELHYRTKEDGGWPGNMAVVKDGKALSIDRSERIGLKPFFQMNRCRYCFDKLNREADISCGDCYITGEECAEGKSSVIIRTEKGKVAWQLCEEDISAEKTSLQAISESQSSYAKEVNANRAKSVNLLYENMPQLLSVTDKGNNRRERQLGKCADSESGCEALYEAIHPSRKRSKFQKYVRRFFTILKPDTQKFLLIDHAGFVNKGAELMLRETVLKANQLFPEYVVTIPHYEYSENVPYCTQMEILPLYRHSKGWRRRIHYLISNRLFRKRRYVESSEISLILDIGGFQFGDQWVCDGYTQKWKDYYSQFTNPQLKLLFLPQAFGPFETKEAQDVIRFVYSKADALYARESISFGYLKEALPDVDKVQQFSDFTCLFKPNVPLMQLLPEKQYVVLIPNMRMLDKRDDMSRSYMELLCRIVDSICMNGEHVVLLNHEGFDDEVLAMEINEKLGASFPVLSNLNAEEVKAVIGKSKLLVSSRFHGVVSGLSQGVPTFCTSWSHKYQELLNDYGVPDNLLSVDSIEDSVSKILDAVRMPLKYSPSVRIVKEKELETLAFWAGIRSFY